MAVAVVVDANRSVTTEGEQRTHADERRKHLHLPGSIGPHVHTSTDGSGHRRDDDTGPFTLSPLE